MALPGILLFLLLCGENCLQSVAGLGDVGEIDFWGNRLRGARRSAAPMGSGFGAATEMRADLFGLVFLQRTGVGLALSQT
jgi:hypothetical protein